MNGRSGIASKTYFFPNGQALGVCGSMNEEDSTLTEFSLFKCGDSSAIDEWDATETCILLKKYDTLTIAKLYQLPIGKNLSLISSPFYIIKYFFYNQELFKASYFRKDLRKYSEAEIADVITRFKYLPVQKNEHETVIHIGSMLFWASVSGSKDAEKYFLTIERCHGPFDGGIAEEWRDLVATYKLWKDHGYVKRKILP